MPGSRPLLRRLWSGTKHLWERAKREHSTPREVGWSVGVGVFSGCLPFYGAHLAIAFVLATVLRLNRLWAMVGSRVSWTGLFVWIAFAEVETGHRIRTGAWSMIGPRDIREHYRELSVDWLLGAVCVGSALAAALGLVAYAVARRRVSERTPGARLPPSSGSPPSAPPAPPG